MQTIKTIAIASLACLFALTLAFATSALANDAKPKAGPGPGDTPPAMPLGLTRRNEEITLEQSAGKVRVVTFWPSWCGPCRQEIVMLNKLQEVAKDSLAVITINIEDRQTFKEVTRQFHESKVTMTNDPSKRIHNAYGVNGIPHMLIIGKDGKVVSVKKGYSEAALPGLLREIETEMQRV
ncbi:MAG: TlpA family protein disulfide reductase [Betaproteobacteria bacterium]|nr:TlpA family protein disulfide reductase [Betaproteobacteria bacterium]